MKIPFDHELEVHAMLLRLGIILGDVDKQIKDISTDLDSEKDCGEGDCNEVLSIALEDMKDFKSRIKTVISILSGKKDFSAQW